MEQHIQELVNLIAQRSGTPEKAAAACAEAEAMRQQPPFHAHIISRCTDWPTMRIGIGPESNLTREYADILGLTEK